MQHLRANDPQNTVIMVQPQNEMGSYGLARDHSPEAERLFRGPVPAELVRGLRKQSGSWTQVSRQTVTTSADVASTRDLDFGSLMPRTLRELGLNDEHAGLMILDPALPLGYTRDLELLPNTLPPERHLGYAVQWFGLALAVLLTAAVLSWRSRKDRRRR